MVFVIHIANLCGRDTSHVGAMSHIDPTYHMFRIFVLYLNSKFGMGGLSFRKYMLVIGSDFEAVNTGVNGG